MKRRNDIKDLLDKLIGNNNTLSNNVLFIDFTGSHEKGQYLSQLWYWSSRTRRNDGFFAKSYSEWYEEIRVREHSIRRYTKEFVAAAYLKTKVTKFNGKNTLHYYLDRDKLTQLLIEFASTPDNLQGVTICNPTPDTVQGVNLANCQVPQTETSTENTTEIHTHTPQTSEEVKNQILNASIHTDSIENRIAVWKIVEPYLSTESFKQQWQFMNAGTVNANDLMKEWVTKADWFDVQNFRINRMTGWIKNYKRPAQNSYRGKYTPPPQDTTYTPPVTTPRARQSVPVISPEEMARIREERRVN